MAIWKDVVGYEGLYEVSDSGQVRSVRTGEILRPWVNVKGYEIVSLSNLIRTSSRVNRLVCEAFHGPAPDDKPNALHRDGDQSNNRADNLHWGSTSENAQDLVRHGRHNNARKTHCKRNHEFTPENTRISRRGFRECRSCIRMR